MLNYSGLERKAVRDQLTDFDLVVTTYGTLRRDIVQLKDIEFDYAILDEAQAVKNPSSQAAKAVRLLNARHRLAMTGTPVENHLDELWSLLEFLNPGMLGHCGKLTDLFVGRRGKGTNGSNCGTNGAAQNESLALLARALRPFLLRRTKQQVLTELPPKSEQTLYCELDDKERKLYDELREHYRQTLLARVSRDGVKRSKIHVLEALLRLRQAACHPGLLDKKRTRDSSSKLETLLEQLAEVVSEGHKALVFSQFTSLLAIVRHQLDERKIVYEYLDGKTVKRQAARRALSDRSGLPAVPHQPQGRRTRPEPHGGRLRVHPRPLVEPGRRGPGRRSRPSDRPKPPRVRLSTHRPRHRRGKNPRTPSPQTRPGRRDHLRRQQPPPSSDRGRFAVAVELIGQEPTSCSTPAKCKAEQKIGPLRQGSISVRRRRRETNVVSPSHEPSEYSECRTS